MKPEVLQEYCIASIAKSIDRFCYSYSTTDDNDLRQRFELLQKRYSFELISSTCLRGNMQDRYVHLLFSEHLKSINTWWFSKLSCQTIHEIFTKIGHNFENVTFNNFSIVDNFDWKTIICHLSNVKVISYEKMCNNDVLKYIAKYCPRLETLDVQNFHRVSDDGVRYFYQKDQGKLPCPLLKEFFVESHLVQKKSIKNLLQNLPLLEDVEHYSELPGILYDLHKKNLNSLDKVKKYNLLHLDLSDYVNKAHTKRYEEILKVCTSVCPKLKSFCYPLAKLEHLNFCSLLPNVEVLNLNCANNTHIEVNDVLKQKSGKLTRLTLHNCCVSLSVLGQCVRLNDLKLKRVKIRYNEGEFIPMFHNLKILHIKHLDLSRSDYFKVISHILVNSPNLEELYLKNCTVFTSEMKNKILKCCEQCALKTIDIGGTRVDTDFLKVILVTCTTLKTLDLDEYVMDEQLEDELRTFSRTLPHRPKISISMELSESDLDSDG